MDDLLSLMEEGPAPPGHEEGDGDHAAAAANSSVETSDAAATATSGRSDGSRGFPPSSILRYNGGPAAAAVAASPPTASSRPKPIRCTKPPAQKKKSNTVDEHTNLRIVDRRTSRLDLIDLLSPLDFRTAPSLSAMSLRDLSALVTVPSNPRGGGGGTANFAGGKTNLATMGVLFRSSSTKLSTNGRAYSIFQLGDLTTGPCVSVFLFGEAYSRHTGSGSHSGREGSVVAILGPNILPPRRGEQTSLALSVSDARQVVHVGTAQDYGVCAGTTWAKRGGRFVNTRCKEFADKRLGPYCRNHRWQANRTQVDGGGGGASERQAQTFIQKARMESAARAGAGGSASTSAAVTFKNCGMVNAAAATAASCSRGGGFNSSSALSDAVAQAGMMDTPAGKVVTRIPQQQQQQQPAVVHRGLLRAPHQMKISTTSLGSNQSRSGLSGSKMTAPAAAGSLSATSKSRDILGDAINNINGSKRSAGQSGGKTSLVQQHRQQQQKKEKVRKLANLVGFNGAVQVPTPSRVLFGHSSAQSSAAAAAAATMAASSTAAVTPSPDPEAVRARQWQLAEARKQRAAQGGGGEVIGDGGGQSSVANLYQRGRVALRTDIQSHHRPTAGASIPSSGGRLGTTRAQMDSLFEGLDDLDRSEVMQAKSRFETEADAERYARSRQIVNDLERREAQREATEARKKKKTISKARGGGGEQVGIKTEWECKTCQRTSATKPVSCLLKKHAVKRKREVKGAVTQREAREKLSKKSVEDGGLVLGTGLEWSGFKGA